MRAKPSSDGPSTPFRRELRPRSRCASDPQPEPAVAEAQDPVSAACERDVALLRSYDIRVEALDSANRAEADAAEHARSEQCQPWNQELQARHRTEGR